MTRVLAALVAMVLALAVAATALAAPGSKFRPAKQSRLGVVATESWDASLAARAALDRGGNAIDAAATAVLALGVARPQSCGIGGGGFLVYRSRTGAVRTLDFRERAPAAFTRESLNGPGLHRDFTGHLTVGVPGTLAGMTAALERYGTIDLRDALRPAERHARRGFKIPRSLSKAMADNARRLALFPAARARYLQPDGTPFAPGAVLRQPELGASLRRIMREGPRALYGGDIGRAIVRDMRTPRPDTRDPGLLTVRDLRRYRPIWRAPVRTRYRGRLVIGMGPPSSGGIAVAEMLGILERFDLAGAGAGSADALHWMAEAQKIAFADRGRYVADPGYVPQPTDTLISKTYTATRAGEISRDRAKTYQPVQNPPTRPAESTTHVSVVDAAGNAVAVTCTIEQEFGSAVVAPGTGILLNNELTDFGAPGTANEPAPGKRPRSSMAPTIVVEPDGRPSMVLGGAGGARIIMGVLVPIVQHVDFGLPLDQALDAPRLDAANGQGGRLELEDARLGPAVTADLERRGHRLLRLGEYAIRPRVNAAGVLAGGRRAAVSDPRTDDGAITQRRRARRTG
jgi:gamma-glutamyltranspeptidase/glutathione hydrolase